MNVTGRPAPAAHVVARADEGADVLQRAGLVHAGRGERADDDDVDLVRAIVSASASRGGIRRRR